MKTEETLIIGEGEVGTALFAVLSEAYDPVYTRDLVDLKVENIKWLHICFPYSKDFVNTVKKYILQYKPVYTIIHSTVAVGTTRKIGKNVWHSPVRGLHPDLALGIKTFIKYIGGEFNNEVLEYFRNAGIETVYTDNPETTELGKILDTTYYGWNIAFCKEAEIISKKYGADFSVAYTQMNSTYNSGYTKLGRPYFTRPVLTPKAGKIGGHCVISNCKLLKAKICRILLDLNKKW